MAFIDSSRNNQLGTMPAGSIGAEEDKRHWFLLYVIESFTIKLLPTRIMPLVERRIGQGNIDNI